MPLLQSARYSNLVLDGLAPIETIWRQPGNMLTFSSTRTTGTQTTSIIFAIHVRISLPRMYHWLLHNVRSRHSRCGLVAPVLVICGRSCLGTHHRTLHRSKLQHYIVRSLSISPTTHSLLDALRLLSYWKFSCCFGAKLLQSLIFFHLNFKKLYLN